MVPLGEELLGFLLETGVDMLAIDRLVEAFQGSTKNAAGFFFHLVICLRLVPGSVFHRREAWLAMGGGGVANVIIWCVGDQREVRLSSTKELVMVIVNIGSHNYRPIFHRTGLILDKHRLDRFMYVRSSACLVLPFCFFGGSKEKLFIKLEAGITIQQIIQCFLELCLRVI